MRYKLGKQNIVPDTLSRLPIARNQTFTEVTSNVLDDLHAVVYAITKIGIRTTLSPNIVNTYSLTLVELSEEFKAKLVEGYKHNDKWR